MIHDRLDAEQLASLLEGRLRGSEREAVLAKLAGSTEDTAVLADAAAIAWELGDSDNTSPVPTVPRPWYRAPRTWGPWLAAAAVIIALGIWRTGVLRQTAMFDHLVSELALPSARLPDRWSDPLWNVTRGPAQATSRRALAVRVGVRVADLAVAMRADPARSESVALDIVGLLVEVPGTGPLTDEWRRVARELRESGGTRSQAVAETSDATADFFSADALELGRLLELARIDAYTSADERGLSPRLTRALLEHLDQHVETASDASLRENVHALTSFYADSSLAQVRSTLTEIVNSLTR